MERLGVVDQPGHGFYARRCEEDVMARIDTLINEGLLCIERSWDGLPLLGYTLRALDVAKGYVVELWLAEARAGEGEDGLVTFSFLMAVGPQLNHETVELLVERVGAEAMREWLPMLQG